MASSKIVIFIKASSTNPELFLTEKGKNAVVNGDNCTIAEAWTPVVKDSYKFKNFGPAEKALNLIDGELITNLPLPMIGRRTW